MPQSVMSVPQVPASVGPVVVPVAEVCTGLLALFTQISDGRRDQGRDHPVAAVLALAAAATVAGMGGYTAITGWVADVPAQIRHDLYLRSGAQATTVPPSKATIWRVLTGADPEAFDTAVGTWLTRAQASSAADTGLSARPCAVTIGGPGALATHCASCSAVASPTMSNCTRTAVLTQPFG